MDGVAHIAHAKGLLINEIERLSSSFAAEYQVVQENDAFLNLFYADLLKHSASVSPLKGSNTLLRLNIGGHNVDIKLSALAAARWNCFSCLLAPHWQAYLLKDNTGRVFLDFDLEWIEPLLNYLRTNTWSDGGKSAASIQKPVGCNIQMQLGFETIIDIFELNDIASHGDATSQATSRTSSFTNILGAGALMSHNGDTSETATVIAETRADIGSELFIGLNSHLQSFLSSLTQLVKQMESKKEEHMKKYKEIIFVKDYLKHWLVQCYGDQAHFHLQQLQAAKAMSPVKSRRRFGGEDSSFQPAEKKASRMLYDSLDEEILAMSGSKPKDPSEEEFGIVSAPLNSTDEQPGDEAADDDSDSSDSEDERDTSVEYHALLSAKTEASSSANLRLQIDKVRDILSICTKLFMCEVPESLVLRLPSDDSDRDFAAPQQSQEPSMGMQVQQPIVYFNIGGEIMCILRQTLLVAFPRSLFPTIVDCAARKGTSSGDAEHTDMGWADISADDVETLGLDIDEHGRIFMDVPKGVFKALLSYARLYALLGHDPRIKIYVPKESLDYFFTLQELLQISEDFPIETA
eukprot:gene34110-41284_t